MRGKCERVCVCVCVCVCGGGGGLELHGSGKGQVVGSCECGNEPLVSIKLTCEGPLASLEGLCSTQLTLFYYLLIVGI